MLAGWKGDKFFAGLVEVPEVDVSGRSPRLHDMNRWSCPKGNGGIASEVEVWDFLYGLVRILKPEVVVETGCYRGWTSYAIGRALSDNKYGYLIACDPVGAYADETAERCADLPVFVHNLPSKDMVGALRSCDLLFSDSDPQAREEEIKLLKTGAIAVVHDTYVYPDLGEMCRSNGAILFDTPRGFGILKKT